MKSGTRVLALIIGLAIMVVVVLVISDCLPKYARTAHDIVADCVAGAAIKDRSLVGNALPVPVQDCLLASLQSGMCVNKEAKADLATCVAVDGTFDRQCLEGILTEGQPRTPDPVEAP